ncbi:MAG: lysozyme inhibitor LprI family protein [Phenylobacterium sp.]
MSSYPGFRSLADPSDDGLYPGYAAPSATLAPPPVASVSHRPTRGVVVAGGIAIALGLGLAVGFMARPELDTASDIPARPMSAAAPGAQQGLTIQPGAPQAVATVKPSGKLQVLPPEMAGAARTIPAAAPSAAAPAAVRDVSDVVREPASAPPPAPRVDPPYPRFAAAEGACAGGAAAQMVCADPELGAADRALNQAYRRALRSGAVPPDELRADQQDWLAIREDAARRSPRALARAYDRRIDELNELADDPQ